MKNWLMVGPCSSTQKEESLSNLKDILIASPSMAPEAVTPKGDPASSGLTAAPYLVVNMPHRPVERSTFLVIKTPLLPDWWEVTLAAMGLLDSFADVVQGICKGFNFGVPVHIENTYIPKNHSSAHANPSVIVQYICKELVAGHYTGPFPPCHLEALIGPFRSSPLGLVPKTSCGRILFNTGFLVPTK